MRMRWAMSVLLLAVAGMGAWLMPTPDPETEPATEMTTAPINVLVFSKTGGFRHGNIPFAIEALGKLSKQTGFRMSATEDAAEFIRMLDKNEVVVFLNTTGDILDDAQQTAFEKYIRGGGGFVGIHAAADTEYDWPFFGKLVGAYFKSHPPVQDATVHVVDRTHPSTAHLSDTWQRKDEWYDYHAAPVEGCNVLCTLDESTYKGGKMGDHHPIAWYHEFEGGRAFYTGGGHTKEAFEESGFLAHIRGAIYWAAGRELPRQGATLKTSDPES